MGVADIVLVQSNGWRLRKDLGVPLETIMGILRHADIRETLVYAPYSIDEGRSAMGKLDGMAVSVHPFGPPSVAVPVLADPGNR